MHCQKGQRRLSTTASRSKGEVLHCVLREPPLKVPIRASSVADVEIHMTDVLFPIAVIFDLTLNAFGTEIVAGSGKGGNLTLSRAWGTGLEPSPITPTDNDGAWGILSGTIQAAVFSSTPNAGRIPVVIPALFPGMFSCLLQAQRRY